jgi:hypothetical protein
VEKFPKPQDGADRVKRKMAFEQVHALARQLLSGPEIKAWVMTQIWIHESQDQIAEAEPLDQAFMYYHYHKRLPPDEWLGLLEAEIPGAQQVLVKILEWQDKVYSSKDGDGATQLSAYRPDAF